MSNLKEFREKILMTNHSTKDVSSIVFHDDFSIPVYNTIDMSWAEFERKCEEAGGYFPRIGANIDIYFYDQSHLSRIENKFGTEYFWEYTRLIGKGNSFEDIEDIEDMHIE